MIRVHLHSLALRKRQPTTPLLPSLARVPLLISLTSQPLPSPLLLPPPLPLLVDLLPCSAHSSPSLVAPKAHNSPLGQHSHSSPPQCLRWSRFNSGKNSTNHTNQHDLVAPYRCFTYTNKTCQFCVFK